MADELALRFRLEFNKGGAKVSRAHSIDVDVTGDAFLHNVREIGTGEETIALAGTDVGAPGYFYVANLDATNTVRIGLATGVYIIELLPGEVSLVRLLGSAGTIYIISLVAACLVEYILIEL